MSQFAFAEAIHETKREVTETRAYHLEVMSGEGRYEWGSLPTELRVELARKLLDSLTMEEQEVALKSVTPSAEGRIRGLESQHARKADELRKVRMTLADLNAPVQNDAGEFLELDGRIRALVARYEFRKLVL
jgi:hypothetical protein